MKKAKFSITVCEGHIRAKIYKTPYRGSIGFMVVWYEGQVRMRKLFADLGDTQLHARARVGGRGYIRPDSRWERRNVSTAATE